MNLKNKIKNFPHAPGIYLMKDNASRIIYIGKATSLYERVRSYFSASLPIKTARQMEEVSDIKFIESDSSLEALILESRLIKKYSPKYNVDEKDDKSRIYVHFTREDFPRIHILRETDLVSIKEKSPTLFGPFLSAASVSDALELIRKIVPFRSCRVLPKKKCLYGYLGLCEAPCENGITEDLYKKRIRQVKNFFEGKKSRVLSQLNREMKLASRNHSFEKAAKIRNRIFALEHLKEVFAIRETQDSTVFRKIEGYDISNISGVHATGAMVVFIDGVSEKSEYRKFKIKLVSGANDIAMIKEVLHRRFKKIPSAGGWLLPDLILIDGGRGQVGAALMVLKELKLKIPVLGIAKGRDRKKDEFITSQILPRQDTILFKTVRDEAHRFARNYYQKLHRKTINS